MLFPSSHPVAALICGQGYAFSCNLSYSRAAGRCGAFPAREPRARGSRAPANVCRIRRAGAFPRLRQTAVKITVRKGASPANCRACARRGAVPLASPAAPGADLGSGGGSRAPAAHGASPLRGRTELHVCRPG